MVSSRSSVPEVRSRSVAILVTKNIVVSGKMSSSGAPIRSKIAGLPSLRPTNRAAVSSAAAMRSHQPALDGAGMRPHNSRAARSYSPAASVSGPPRRPSTTRPATDKKSEATQAASATAWGSVLELAWVCSVARAAAAVACSQICARSPSVTACRSSPAEPSRPPPAPSGAVAGDVGRVLWGRDLPAAAQLGQGQVGGELAPP